MENPLAIRFFLAFPQNFRRAGRQQNRTGACFRFRFAHLNAAARMEAFLIPLLPHCKSILLVAPPPMKRGAWVPTDELVTESIQLAEKYKLLAKKLNIYFVDTRHWDIELTFDGVHFTEAGHHTFAESLRNFLRKDL